MSGSTEEDRFGISRREKDIAEYLNREEAIEDLFDETQPYARAVGDWDGGQFIGWLVADPDTMLRSRSMEQLRNDMRAHAEALSGCREVCLSIILTDVVRQLQRDEQLWSSATRFPQQQVPRDNFQAHGLTDVELQSFLSHYQHRN